MSAGVNDLLSRLQLIIEIVVLSVGTSIGASGLNKTTRIFHNFLNLSVIPQAGKSFKIEIIMNNKSKNTIQRRRGFLDHNES